MFECKNDGIWRKPMHKRVWLCQKYTFWNCPLYLQNSCTLMHRPFSATQTRLRIFFTSITVPRVAVTPKMTTMSATTTKKSPTNTSACSKSGWTFCFPERFVRSPWTGGSSPRSRCRTQMSEAPGKYCHRWVSARYSRKECSCNPPPRMKWQKYIFMDPEKSSRLRAPSEVISK